MKTLQVCKLPDPPGFVRMKIWDERKRVIYFVSVRSSVRPKVNIKTSLYFLHLDSSVSSKFGLQLLWYRMYCFDPISTCLQLRVIIVDNFWNCFIKLLWLLLYPRVCKNTYFYTCPLPTKGLWVLFKKNSMALTYNRVCVPT